jgi:hypothetical protein
VFKHQLKRLQRTSLVTLFEYGEINYIIFGLDILYSSKKKKKIFSYANFISTDKSQHSNGKIRIFWTNILFRV